MWISRRKHAERTPNNMKHILKEIPEPIRKFLRDWNNEISDDLIDLNAPIFDGRPVLHQIALLTPSDKYLEPSQREGHNAPWIYRKTADFSSELIELGASVNALDKDGKTAIWWATLGDNTALIRLLLEKGAITMYVDNIGREFRKNALYLQEANLLSKYAFDLIISNEI
ncbi:ankyrin repeat domain-containing protein [Deinococcus psychrotolerans]|uniref:Ankyrin repeat domain-containing protein n=1 Tax=Deinococcus psychrotolerans TaxID=2489213 RepID=A0A3G8YD43_9DEIO|nr:ankyrin repeat domain-containing protein [Deinococcus psychrotolerans]AZI43319.1 ankyrin repeat domain-containing protein [Deinococcus psychrotolerans]